MRIAFIVNTLGITGGIKVVLTHANLFQKKGHEVSIIHFLRLDNSVKGRVIAFLKYSKYVFLNIIGRNSVDWFSIDNNIKIIRTLSLKGMINFDAVIATANETADFVAQTEMGKAEKYYFIQAYELWTRDRKLVESTYKLPLKKIVISTELKNILWERLQEHVIGSVCNGVDIKAFDKTGEKLREIESSRKISLRKVPLKLLFQYHILENKGIPLLFSVLQEVMSKYPEIEIRAFGSYPLPNSLPISFEYYFKPSQQKLIELYLDTDIFVFSSSYEGGALPPMEAMAARCAVVTTAVGAVPDYAQNGKSALIVSPNDRKGLIQAIIKLLEDDKLRIKLACEGYKAVQHLSWDNSNNQFEQLLTKTLHRK